MPILLSTGVYVSEEDLSAITPAVPASVGAFAGLFAKGPVFTPVLITNELELVDIFGVPDNTNYEHFYSVWNFLQYAGAIYVVRAVDPDTALNAGIAIQSDSDTVVLLVDDASVHDVADVLTGGTSGATGTIDAINGDYIDVTMLTLAFEDGETVTDDNGADTSIIQTIIMANTAHSAYIEDLDSYDDAEVASDVLHIYAKYPGIEGNGYKIAIAGPTYLGEAIVQGGSQTFLDILEEIPSAAKNEFALLVLDSTDDVKEKLVVSLTPQNTNDRGEVNYIDAYLRNNSKYLTGYKNANVDFVEDAILHSTAISGGNAGAAGLADGDYQRAYDLYANTEQIDVTFLIAGPHTSDTMQDYITQSVAEIGKFSVAFLDCVKGDVVGTSLTDSARITALKATYDDLDSKYAFALTNWKNQYDKWNQVYRWVPLGGDIAGLWAQSAVEKEPWFAVGAFDAQIKNVNKLAWNPAQAYRDQLAVARLNAITEFAGQGTVIFSQRILTSIASSMNRMNVRMLLIYIEKALSKSLPAFLMKPNDDFLRNQITALVVSFMNDIEGRRGVNDPEGGEAFRVVCDITNNTQQVIDNQELRIDLLLKPTQAAEKILLNVAVTTSGANFDEIVAR